MSPAQQWGWTSKRELSKASLWCCAFLCACRSEGRKVQLSWSLYAFMHVCVWGVGGCRCVCRRVSLCAFVLKHACVIAKPNWIVRFTVSKVTVGIFCVCFFLKEGGAFLISIVLLSISLFTHIDKLTFLCYSPAYYSLSCWSLANAKKAAEVKLLDIFPPSCSLDASSYFVLNRYNKLCFYCWLCIPANVGVHLQIWDCSC